MRKPDFSSLINDMGGGVGDAFIFMSFVSWISQSKCINYFIIFVPKERKGDGISFFSISVFRRIANLNSVLQI